MWTALCLLMAASWLKIVSPHFELYTTAGEKRGRDAAVYFEQVRSVFTHIRGPQPDARKIRLIAFSNHKEYEPFRLANSSPAYYVGSSDLDCIVLGSISGDYAGISVHEYTHAWMHGTEAAIPTWLQEGLAEVHSTLRQSGGKVWIGEVIPAHLRVLREQKWIPFDQLTRSGGDVEQANHANRTGMFYAESWLLTHMLYLDETYRPAWRAFIKAVMDSSSTDDAVRQAYGKSLPELQQDAQAYIRRNSFPAQWFGAQAQQDAAPAAVSTPSEAEVAVVLAQLYRLIGKPERGDKLLARMSGAPDPNIEQERGTLAWKAGDLAAAREHYLKAMELRSANAKTYLDYAELVHDEHPEQAEAALAKALELEPDSRNAHFLLGYVYAQQNKWPEALKQLEAVREVGADRAFLLFNLLARAQYESGLLPAARQSAAKARKYAGNAAEVAQADSLIRQVGRESEPEARDLPAPRPPEPGAHAEGILRSLECRRTDARMHIETATGELILAIDDPARVELVNPEGRPSLDLACGAQKPRRVRVRYTPGGPAGTDGRLSALQLLP